MSIMFLAYFRHFKILVGCCVILVLAGHCYLNHHVMKSISAQANIADFIAVSQKYGIPVIFVDPVALSSISKDSKGPLLSSPQFHFEMQTSSTFAVEYNLWTAQEAMLQDLAQLGFSISLYKQKPPQTLRTISLGRLLSHVALERSEHLILLVVLYRRGEGKGYLWQGMLHGPAHAGATGVKMANEEAWDLPLGKEQTAWTRFQTSNVTIDGLNLLAPKFPKTFINMHSRAKFIECNHKRASTFYSQYPQDLSRKAQDFRVNAKQVLAKTKQTLDQLDIPFWLSDGTCLGWFRQCDIIPYSRDVDIGVLIKDYKKTLISAMQKNGLNLKRRLGKESDSYELTFQGWNVNIDIFFVYENGNTIWYGSTQTQTGNKYMFTIPKFTLCSTEFLGLLLHVPCDTETYVRTTYGSNWSIPIKKYDWKSSPSNVQQNGRWPKHEWPEVIQILQ